ncbi:hypothetical protein BC830DRAFT_1162797 [Chytriomyces sp. MP71]|nr:hypothetical protein BC830DRAFT_1162797 [Chytriomyces sp. MP71]
MLPLLPHELKTQIAEHLPAHAQFVLAQTGKSMANAILPLIWRVPRLSPLVQAGTWQRFLDAIAASSFYYARSTDGGGETRPFANYASFVIGVDDLGLCVGGEDFQDVADDACLYAYPGRQMHRHDSKLEGNEKIQLQICPTAVIHYGEQGTPESINMNTLQLNTSKDEVTVQEDGPAVRRVHLLKPSSLPFLTPQPTNSLHYAISLILTHCPNIKRVSLSLPLPHASTPFPLQIRLLPNLASLELSTRTNDQTIIHIFESDDSDTHIPVVALKEVKFLRLEVSDTVLAACFTSGAMHAPSLQSLILPSTVPSSKRMASYFSNTLTHRRRELLNPPSHLTYNGILPLLHTYTNLVCLDVSAGVAPPPSPQNTNVIPGWHEEEATGETQCFLLEAIMQLKSLQSLTLSLSRRGGVTVAGVTHVLSHLAKLRCLTLKATCNTADYTGDSTVEEEELMVLPLVWSEHEVELVTFENVPTKKLVLVGLDFVKGGDGVMRSYYSCVGGDLGNVADFRMRFEQAFGDRVSLSIVFPDYPWA